MNLKWWFFKNYAWIGVVLAGVVATLLHNAGWPIEQSIASVTAVVGYFHFVQIHRLGETKLFHKLFAEFNDRYNQLNDDLVRVQRGEWTPVLEVKVIDYFNLCAEEYLYYTQGYIYPEVWKSWRKGMSQYLSIRKVRELWEAEAKTDSYYGLVLN